MTDILIAPTARRAFMTRTFGGLAAGTALLALPGCQSMGGYSLVDAVERMLFLSSERAFARMLHGQWLLGSARSRSSAWAICSAPAANVLSGILTSALFKSRIERRLCRCRLSRGAARRAAGDRCGARDRVPERGRSGPRRAQRRDRVPARADGREAGRGDGPRARRARCAIARDPLVGRADFGPLRGRCRRARGAGRNRCRRHHLGRDRARGGRDPRRSAQPPAIR